MAINIGPKIGIDGEKAFRDEIQKIGQQLKVLDSEMKIVTNSFKLEGDEQAGLIAKSEVLTKQIDAQKKGIEELKKGLDASTEAYGKNNVNTLKWQKSLYDAIADVNRMTNELEATEAEMNGAADATGDMEKATVDAGDAAEETGSRFGGLGTALKTVAGLAAATAASVAAATGKLVKDVVSSFSELEQNTGGAEAVFGEYALAIQKTGEEAYKNLGVSQSEYLATANKMGALFQGSGIEQQASLELTEQAMQRAADMASVMGIETSAALEAVAGAAKGNFEMMDNLGVAMNATSIEAYAVGKGLDFVWNEASQADKVQVAMQMFFEKTEQYAGNFARESEKTISGSMGMLKASVKSLTAGLGNAGADMTNLAGQRRHRLSGDGQQHHARDPEYRFRRPCRHPTNYLGTGERGAGAAGNRQRGLYLRFDDAERIPAAALARHYERAVDGCEYAHREPAAADGHLPANSARTHRQCQRKPSGAHSDGRTGGIDDCTGAYRQHRSDCCRRL